MARTKKAGRSRKKVQSPAPAASAASAAPAAPEAPAAHSGETSSDTNKIGNKIIEENSTATPHDNTSATNILAEEAYKTTSNADNETEQEMKDIPVAAPSPSSINKKERATKTKKLKSEKKKKDQDLRTRNLGLGLKISDDLRNPQNTKIVFNDDSADEMEEPFTPDNNSLEKYDDASESDDDDVVEEVTAMDARKLAMKERQAERESHEIKKKKRKRKETAKQEESSEYKAEEEEDGDDLLTGDFFAQLDSVHQSDQKEEKKASLAKKRPLGKHTTFTMQPMESSTKVVVHAGNNENMEIVTLGEDNNTNSASATKRSLDPLSTGMGTKPSSVALALSRSNIYRNSNVVSSKNKDEKAPQWKRSKNIKYGFNIGAAAAVFKSQPLSQK